MVPRIEDFGPRIRLSALMLLLFAVDEVVEATYATNSLGPNSCGQLALSPDSSPASDRLPHLRARADLEQLESS